MIFARKATFRNGTIDLMKFLFTVMVMLFHTNKLFKGGYIAVDFFFVVSGYLMAQSAVKRVDNGLPLGTDTVSFVLHKAKGIFPYYLVAFIFSFAVSQILSGTSLKNALMTLFRSPYNILMLEMAGNFDMGHRVQASWYISAMLLSMLFLYPIRKKNSDVFDHIISPIIFLMFVGWAYQTGSGVAGFTVRYQPNLFMYNGMVRSIAEISIGCTCFTLGKRLQAFDFTFLGKIVVSLIEWGGYFLVFFCAYHYSQTDKDLVLLLLIALSVTLSFSEKGALASVLNNNLCAHLGSFSLQMYLMHEMIKNQVLPYARLHTNIGQFMDRSLGAYLFAYICATVAAAAICRVFGQLLKKGFPAIAQVLKRNCVKK